MKQRILTAIIGIIIVVPIIVYGNWPFIIVAYALATIALFELTRMLPMKNDPIYFFISCLFLWLIIFPVELQLLPIVIHREDIIVGLIVILFISMVVSKNHFTFNYATFLFTSTIYLGLSFHYLLITRFTGLHLFLFILFIIWATDSGAYFIGKRFGKRKLWPAISPNKTIGGAVGGIVFGLILAVVFHFIYPFDRSILYVLTFALIVSITGQIGDLVASAIKRNYGVKDYGNIFPGHGGVLDRLDSFIFVMFVLQLFHFY